MYYHSITKHAAIAILGTLLVACSGGGSGGSGADPFIDGAGAVSITVTNPAPGATLETPDKTVTLAGTAESETDVLSVSWTSDRGGNGEASGSDSWKTDPIPLEVGENNITITAKDLAGKTGTRTLMIIREVGTGSVTLDWSAPTAREDETALTDLAGYYIRYGRMSEIYDHEIKIENPGIVSYVVEGLTSGMWYIVVSAYDSAGFESTMSNEVDLDLP